MKFMLSLLAFGYVASAIPSPSLPLLNPGGIGGVFKGPNSETIVQGPDGSVITSGAEGGEVQTKLDAIVVEEPAAVVAVPEATPVIQAAPVAAVAVPGPAADTEQGSDLIGPSGRIATKGSKAVIAGPSSTTLAASDGVAGQTVVEGPPLVATSPVVSPVAVSVTPGSVALAPALSTPVAITPRPILLSQSTVVTPGPAILQQVPVLSEATATASTLPHVTASATALGPYATASATAGTLRPLPAVTPLPVLPQRPGLVPAVTPLPQVPGLGVTGRVDLPGLIPEDRILRLNPSRIPSGNIIPPEVPVTPRIPVLRPTPGSYLPGLGTVSTTTNIQREEGDVRLSVTPPSVQISSPVPLTPETVGLQHQQALLNTQIQYGEGVPTALPPPANLQIGPQTRLNAQQVLLQTQQPTALPPSLSPQQVLALQNQQPTALPPSLSPQVLALQNQQPTALPPSLGPQVLALQTQQPTALPPRLNPQQALVLQNQPVQPRPVVEADLPNEVLFTPARGPGLTLADVQQNNILSSQLARSDIDPAQVQLTNVPLSAISGLPAGLENRGLLNAELAEGLNRYGRETKIVKKEETGKEEKKLP